MKVAILTSGIMPVPAVQGGAVENLIDFYLGYNSQHHQHDITVYSVWHPNVGDYPALNSEVNHYIYIKVNGWWEKVKKTLYKRTHKGEYRRMRSDTYLCLSTGSYRFLGRNGPLYRKETGSHRLLRYQESPHV